MILKNLQILQNQLEMLQRIKADRTVDKGTPTSDSRGKSVISSSSGSGHGYREDIRDGKA